MSVPMRIHRPLGFFLALVAVSASRSAPPATADPHSALWGRNGERWRPDSRLPDFSYAGFQRGEKPLPVLKGEVSVKDFGAAGDGKTDDTDAFKKAIEASAGKVILVPAGRYKITDILSIRTTGTCIKGAGPRKSVLVFPTPLNEIKPNWGATTGGRRTSNYSWSGGFLSVAGSFARQPLALVTAPAERGDQSVIASTVEAIRVGDDLRLEMTDTSDNTLARHLYVGDPGPMKNLKGRSRESFLCRVTKVDAATRRVHFDRPLRTDVRAAWKPRLFPAGSSVEGVGIEDLGFTFPNTPYRGHFTELGFNALVMSGVRHCWARNLWIHNADSGIFIHGANITPQDIRIDSQRTIEPSRKATGHHGITLGGQDNLLTGFAFETRFMHGITMTRGSAGNVVSGGRGVDLSLDHHRYGPHSNLFTNIDLGEGTRMFQSGGGAALGRHSAAYETFWCIRARRPQAWPAGWGPDRMNLVGVQTREPSLTTSDGKWFEAIEPGVLQPCDLYEAQRKRRLGRASESPSGHAQ